jgi:subtilisin family serine protease
MSITVLPVNVAYSIQDDKPKHVPGRLLIKFNDGISQEVQKWILGKQGVVIEDSMPQINTQILQVPENSLIGMKSKLEKIAGVEYVETDSIIEPQIMPNDSDFPQQWHLKKIGATSGWDLTTGSEDVVIAIIDTGFKLDHPDLADRFVTGYNVLTGDSDVAGDTYCSHGTRVAGVIGPSTNNALGVSGVTWTNKIMPISVTPNADRCATSASNLAKGIIYAVDHGARVANLSWGIYEGDRTITNAARYMYNSGGIVVAAAGNNGQLIKSADNRYIISVGATDKNDIIASFSTKGKFVDFIAPGTSIYTTAVWIPYSSTAGTSFSAPIVSGLIALLFSENPTLSPSQAYDILKVSSVDLGSTGYDTSYGWGRIDVNKALQLVPPYNPPQPSQVQETQSNPESPTIDSSATSAGTGDQVPAQSQDTPSDERKSNPGQDKKSGSDNGSSKGSKSSDKPGKSKKSK